MATRGAPAPVCSADHSTSAAGRMRNIGHSSSLDFWWPAGPMKDIGHPQVLGFYGPTRPMRGIGHR